MSALVSVRLDDQLFKEMKLKAHDLHLTQTDYIRRAIVHMNHDLEAHERNEKLRQASLLVREDSMRVNAEFSRIEYDPDA